MEKKKLVLTASVTGTLSSKDGREPEVSYIYENLVYQRS